MIATLGPRLATTTLVGLLCCAWGNYLQSDEPPATETLEYYQVFVPADRIKDLAAGGYLPIQRDEFQRRLASIRAGQAAAPAVRPSIVLAEYAARLDGEQLVEGVGRWQVRVPDELTGMLDLSACDLPLESLAWDETPARLAVAGLGSGGRFGLLVERPGRVALTWSLRRESANRRELHFRLRLAPSPTSRFELALPPGALASIAGVPLLPLAEAEKRPNALLKELPAGWSRAAWELGGRTDVLLRVSKENAPEAADVRSPTVRSMSVYELSPRGLQVATRLRLSGWSEARRELALALDPGIRLSLARMRDTTLTWRAIAVPAAGEPERIVLQVPEGTPAGELEIELAAAGPIAVGTPWRLPAIRSEGVAWQEAIARVSVSTSLTLRQAQGIESRQLPVAPTPLGEGAEVCEFEFLRPDGAVEVLLAPRPTEVRVAAATYITLAGDALEARQQVEFGASSGLLYELAADVTANWSIESVTVTPAEFLDHWDTTTVDGKTRLVVRMARGVGAGQRARLTILARHESAAPGASLAANELCPCRIRSVENDRYVTALAPDATPRLNLVGDAHLRRLDPLALTPPESELLAGQRTALAFVDDAGAASARFELRQPQPKYAAEIEVEAIADQAGLRTEYRFRCDPEGGQVSKLLVQFAPKIAEPLVWSWQGAESVPFTTRRLTLAERRAAGIGEGSDTWLVELGRPLAASFSFAATAKLPTAERYALALAALPQSISQAGLLIVRAEGGMHIGIEAGGLEAVPVEGAQPDRTTTIRGQFRYEPNRDVQGATRPVALVSRGGKPANSLCWAWLAQVRTMSRPKGETLHQASFWLENLGVAEVTIRWPEGCVGRDAWVGSERIALPVTAAAGQELTVPLSASVRFAKVTIEYVRTGELLTDGAAWSPPFPTLNVPVLQRRWTLWLPSDWAAYGDERYRDSPAAPFDAAGRLLGAMRRPPNERPATIWPVDLSGVGGIDSAAAQRVELTKTTLAQLLAERAASSRPLPWGTVLAVCAQRLAAHDEERPVRLLVDESALAAAGIHATSPIGQPGQAIDAENPLAPIHASGLVFVAGPDATVLLTSLTALARWRDVAPNLTSEGTGNLELARGPLAIEDGDSNWITPAVWIVEPRRPQSPWPATATSPWTTLAESGWRAYELDIPTDEQVSLLVYRPALAQWQGWVALLAALGVAWWLPAGWRFGLAAVAGCLAAGALTLSPIWTPACSGGLVGILAGWALAACWPRGSDPVQMPPDPSTISAPARSVVAATAALATLLTLTWPGHAQEAAPPAARPRPHPVLVPIDAEQKPVGPVVYVPEALYAAVLRQTNENGSAVGYMVSSANYRGSLARDNATGEFELARLDLHYEIEVLRPAARVVLPLGRAGWYLLEEGVRLDGRPVQTQWRDDDGAFEFEVPEPGKHRLELAIRPISRPVANEMGIQLRIPRVARTRVEVEVPDESLVISLPEARGAIVRAAGKWTANVGPTEQLTLRWPLIRAANAASAEVEQLAWLRLRPGSLALDVRVRVRAARVPIGVLRFRLDPALRLLPAGAGQTVGEPGIERRPGEQIVELKLARPLEAGSSFTASFVMSGTSGVGHFLAPLCELLDVSVARRLLAVSCDSNLAFNEFGAAKLAGISAAEFTSAWGGGVAPPQVAFEWPVTADPHWTMAVAPRPPQTRVVNQQLAVGAGRQEFTLLFQVELESTGGYILQHRLQGPPGLLVESCTVSELEGVRETRWTQDDAGRVTLFFAEPMSGRHELTLRGRLPCQFGPAQPLPRVAILGTAAREQTCLLYRRPEVLVAVNEEDHWQRGEPGDELTARLEGRLIATRRELLAEPSARVAISANLPVVTGTQVTRLVRRGDLWEADVDCRLQATGGVVDLLRFDLPLRTGAEVRLDPAMPFEVESVPGENRRRLIVTPREPISDALRLRIVLQLEGALGERRAPDPLPLDWPDLARFLVIPTQYELRPIEGEAARFQSAPLPPELTLASDQPAELRAYSFSGRQLLAVVQRVQSAVGVPQVRLVDIHADWQADGACRATAGFDLEPGDLTACQLALPPNCQLVHVRVAGLPADVEPSGAGVWRVALGPRQLPQRLEVLYTARLAVPLAGRIAVVVPAPLISEPPHGGQAARELSIERMLWTVRGPRWAGEGQAAQPGARVPAQRQEMIRLQSAAGLVDLPADIAAEMPATDINAWYVPWVRRQVAALSALARLRNPGKTGIDPYRDAARLIESEQLALAARFGVTGVRSQVFSDAARAYGPAEFLAATSAEQGPPLRLLFKGGDRQIAVNYPAAGAEQGEQFSAAAIALFVGLLAAIVAALGWFSPLLSRWPHAVGVLGGIGWWLFCSWSWLGWIAIGASLVLLVRSPWGDLSRE